MHEGYRKALETALFKMGEAIWYLDQSCDALKPYEATGEHAEVVALFEALDQLGSTMQAKLNAMR